MGSDFLTGLANLVEDKFGIGENQNHTLDIVENGHTKRYGRLGDFASKFDQTAERKYLEEGYIRLDPFNVNPQQFETLLQEPDATILIKKRAFSSLSENYRSDYMDQEEKLYFKATKLLFQNKCRQISAFEKLSKIERIGAAAGQLDDQLMPMIISLVDEAAASSGDLSGFGNSNAASGFKKLNNIIDKIRKIYAFSPVNNYTTWLTDSTNIFKTNFAQGTGVIELTNVIDFRTTTSVNFNNGTFNLSISDPYKMMLITDYDIEKAISDASNYVANKKFFQLGKESLDTIAANNIKRLNDARQARGASAIEFIISPDTFLGKRVRAIIEKSAIEINFDYDAIPSLSSLISGGGVTVSQESLRGGPEVGEEGLDTGKIKSKSIGGIIFGQKVANKFASSEEGLFQDAVSAIFTSLEYKKSAQSTIARQSDYTVSNDPSSKLPLDINYVRRKLRFHYGNKQIVQPMDQVHIFIGSKSKTDNKILSGLQNMFTGLGYFQKLNNTVFDLKNQLTTLFNPSQNINLQLEKSIFVGPSFPNGLWAMMRNLFVSDKSGCHVFGGVVSDASEDYTPGKYIVSVSGKDNTSYFDFGTINMNPGVDTFNGPLYDPLTPFKTRFDTVASNFKDQHPEFLEENKALIQTQTPDQGLIKYKSGRNAGKPVTLDSFFQDKEITKGGVVRNVYHAPDGLVYKWKEGIGTLVYSGDSFSATDPEKIGVPAITTDPFAGQDIMNVLSLLITGVPYNFATYYKAVREFDNFGRSPQSGQDPAVSFFNSLNTSIKKNNLLWGAFVPFKRLIIDDETFQGMISKQITILNQNSVITQQLEKIQDLQNKYFIASTIPAERLATDDKAKALLDGLKSEITRERGALNIQTDKLKEDIQSTIPISIIGNDVTFDPDQAQDKSHKNLSKPDVRAELRKRINFLTRRLSWAVRANEDKNLLIVDDSYDKDYDILAIEKQLKGKIEQFSNEYTTVKEKISSIAGLLNLEVFCDTQGHIRIRPQQYNRMPSSVFYRMMQMKKTNGIQIYPNYLETLFVDQLSTLLKRMEILETQIRLDGAILGISDDSKLALYLNNSGISSNGSFVPFQFFTNQAGDIEELPNLLNKNKPEDQIKPNSFDSKIAAQNAAVSVFNAADRAKLITTVLPSNNITSSITSDVVNRFITILFNKSGQQVTLDNFIIPQATGSVVPPSLSQVDVVKVTQDLSEKVSERQKLIKVISSAFKNAKEALSLDGDPKNTSNKLLFPNLYGNNNVPEIFSHMIEDESYDDYGPGSGTRYVIRDHQILRLSISEVPPAYTMVEVQGQFDPFISTGNLPAGLSGSFPKGGNALVTAAAVDYDLWRMYGFRSMHAIHAPYLSSPETQCAPYAVSLLSRARRDILQGSITIAGNEYMQPGEVVYIESRGLLFYVENVSHNFTFGSTFTTTLTLKYGHNPGEYIPTHLDVIGKLLYNNRDTSTAINYRQSNVYNESQLGAVVANPEMGFFESELDIITKGNFGEFNLKVINDILYSAAGVVGANNVKNTNVEAMVELRIFYNSSNGSINSRLSNARNTLLQILTGQVETNNKTLANKPNLRFDKSNVVTSDIDISDQNERRSPSQHAIDMARNLLKTNSGLGGTGNVNGVNLQIKNPLQNAIANNVIDCIITFVNKETK